MNSGAMIQRNKIERTHYRECNLLVFSLTQALILSSTHIRIILRGNAKEIVAPELNNKPLK